MHKIFSHILVITLLISFISCKRNQKPLGGVSQPSIDLPASDKTASVHALPADGTLAELSSTAVVQLSPEQLFIQNCAACHQATGKGIPGAFPPLDGSPYVIGDNVERMASIMIYGLTGPIKVLGVEYNSAMAPLGATNDDKALAAIATYVRSAWSNKAAPVSEEVFASARKKWGSRGPFTIQELGE